MFLSEILAHKEFEVELAIRRRSLKSILSEIECAPKVRPFDEALRNPHRQIGLIAEVKKASPSAGIIRQDFNHLQIARDYASAGADCLSILTDENYFQGSLNYLLEIKQTVAVPLLRKDFIINPYQIYESRAAGADAILLIVAALDRVSLADFYQLGCDLGMNVLIETHSREEMQIAAELPATLVGINSRNLKTFVTDLAIFEQVAPLAPKEALLVAESAIKSADDVQRAVIAGASAILVGETLMRTSNIAKTVETLTGNLRESAQ
jgi:indole-3-glycerol phosphate synthase